ncbi:hypothetical protein DIE18_02425 [Burkholderia sp. Bp9125]|nr:hypothetical protein DIE18_02425 [Burkholderia sp. Bp9125]
MSTGLGRKVAHYFFSDGNEIVIYVEKRKVRIREVNGDLPVCPDRKGRYPHPNEEDGVNGSIPSFEEVGLYYGYEMADTGWSGDC